MTLTMDLRRTFTAILDDFYCELAIAMELHQAQMKEVCHSIKAHDHWVHYEDYFPHLNHCRFCGVAVSPEFDMRRHRGLCLLLTYNGWIPLTGLFLECPAIINALRHRGTKPLERRTAEACHSTSPCV